MKFPMRVFHRLFRRFRVPPLFGTRDVTIHALEKDGRTIRFSIREHRFMLVLDGTGRLRRRNSHVAGRITRPKLWLEHSGSFIGITSFLEESLLSELGCPKNFRQARHIVLTLFNAAMPPEAALLHQETLDFVRMIVHEAGFEDGRLTFPDMEIESGSGSRVPAPYSTRLPHGFHALRFMSGGETLTLDKLVEGAGGTHSFGGIHSFAAMPLVPAPSSGHELLTLKAKKKLVLARFGIAPDAFDIWAIAVRRARAA